MYRFALKNCTDEIIAYTTADSLYEAIIFFSNIKQLDIHSLLSIFNVDMI
jgi:hypothetical protein